jgi:hypothetical protein
MLDLPMTKKCSFCGEDARLCDRRKFGIRWIICSFVVGLATGWYFGWVVGVMDWSLLFIFGFYSALRSERYIYRCKACTNVMGS